jgi:hypothetical protein
MRVSVAILIDGQFVGRIQADDYRRDLAVLGKGDGEYGFRFPLDDSYLSGKEHRVEVLIASNGVRLERSSLLLRGRRLDALSERSLPRTLSTIRDMAFLR